MTAHAHNDDTEQPHAQMVQGEPPGASPRAGLASDASVETRIAFAQSAFANIQELTRTMDAKANYLLASVALLTAALGLVASRIVAATVREDWQRLLKGAGIMLMLLYLLVAFAVIFVATGIYQARSQRVSSTTDAPGMLFPLMLLKRYSAGDRTDESEYLNRLRTLQPDDILRDYSNQIIEVSIIYEAKQKQVNLCLGLFRWTGVLWLVTMLVVVTIIVVLP